MFLMLGQIKLIFIKIKSGFFALTGSFIIVAGWDWYHLARRPHWRFVLLSFGFWLALTAGFYLFKFLFVHLVGRFRRHPFWGREFASQLDRLWFCFSLLFVIFFFRNELASLSWAAAVFILLFLRLRVLLFRHPLSRPWLVAHDSVFTLGFFIFLLSAVYQFLSYRYYILDPSGKIFNIVFFRAWSMTVFWLGGFALSSLVYWRCRGRHRYLPIFFWSALFLAVIFFWLVDIGILLFSGLHLSPFMFSQVSGAGQLFFTGINLSLLAFLLLALAVFYFVLRRMVKAHLAVPGRHWYYYNWLVILMAVFSIFAFSSFQTSPEYITVRNFLNYYRGAERAVDLLPSVRAKLERFGLRYDPDEFFVARREKIYEADKNLLPEKFSSSPPNIIIIFLESFSARLTGVYNPTYADLTPNLLAMARDPGTTVFKNVFNASTPTVTGTLSELCSFYTPIGHNEIEIDKRLQRHYLLCLPEVLKKFAGFQLADYITAVDKDYAGKDGIFRSMGVDKVWGTGELAERIVGEPLAWGYSDHQLFPFLTDWMNKNADRQPFLAMLSTVDSHPPFNLAKDVIKYKEGKNNLLDTIHTTDDAFGVFWRQFKQSRFYDNTVVVAIADHAVFPAAYTADTAPAGDKPSYYDEIFFNIYVPESVLPEGVDTFASSADLAPTLLHMLNVNVANSFEGHSIFDDREKYPDILGMHEFGFYMNQRRPDGSRSAAYDLPANLNCVEDDFDSTTTTPLSFCDFLNFYQWKRSMLEEGRFWKN